MMQFYLQLPYTNSKSFKKTFILGNKLILTFCYRIVNTFAEEAALEDSIYYLGEGLRTGKVDLEQFQKHIRVLARKQFMLRALLQKCRQKAGLAG